MDAEHTITDRLAEANDQQQNRESRSSRWRSFAIALILLVAALAGGWYFWRSSAPSQPAAVTAAPRPITVAAATVETADLPVSLDGLGTVTPLATVTVKTQIAGKLTEIGFREGQHVRKGDFLAEVDPRPYQAALDQAEGQLAKDQALLRNAELDLARYRRLVAEDSIARQTLDTQASLVRQYRATVQVDQALVDDARLNLGYCHIVSPIGGRVGLRLVDEGNYVQPSDANGIVIVTQMQPISVVFTIPEDELPKVATRMRTGARLPVQAYDRTGTTLIASGVLTTIDNLIDTTTGTIKLKAIFDNADEQLFPNQFVTVRLLVETIAGATLAPRAAVQRGSAGAYVYVIGPDNTVAFRNVTVGVAEGERIQVLAGLSPGEQVVTDGIDRLRDGSTVTVAGAAHGPAAASTPTPAAPAPQ